MAESKAFWDGKVEGYLKIEKKDGNVLYYKVVDGQNYQIFEDEYNEAHKINKEKK